MHVRRISCLLLGGWLAGSLFMITVATQNFASVDRLLAAPAPGAARQIQAMGHDAARAFLRYLVSEQNRWYFKTWEQIQLGLGIVLFLALFFGTMGNKGVLWLSLLMLAIVAAERWLLTPEIIQLGRAIDFLPVEGPSPERTKFWMFHSAYSGLELAKLALAAILAWQLVLRPRRTSAQLTREVDMVNEPHHSHVDR